MQMHNPNNAKFQQGIKFKQYKWQWISTKIAHAIIATDDTESVSKLCLNCNTCHAVMLGQPPPCTVQCKCNAYTRDAMQCNAIPELAKAISKGA